MTNKVYSDYRGLFLGNNTNGKYINFDNAATTQCFAAVARMVNDFLPQYSSIHRGKGAKAKYCTELYETSRKMVAEFVGADLNYNSVIYTKNTTESINLLSACLANSSSSNVILTTEMEHHSNDLPWRGNYQVDYIGLDGYGQLDMDDYLMKLKKYAGRLRLVAVTGASNVTGLKNPIHFMARLAHLYGAEILVDGAQLVPHALVNMLPCNDIEHIDYLAFSAHKMYAPFGTGVLVGWKHNFNHTEPYMRGGGTVMTVMPQHVRWLNTPERNEAGTPNIIGAIALAESIDMLSGIGMDQVESYESMLTQYAYSRLQSVDRIRIYCPYSQYGRVSILSFNIDGMNHEEVAEALEKENISVRNGCFCAQNYVRRIQGLNPSKIPVGGLVRVSFALYNKTEEIDYFVNVLKEITKKKR